jgi:tetratricopeptide (TPR) repeat protein
MNEPLESLWKKSWNRPRYFFPWLALFSVAGLGVAVILDNYQPHFNPPMWVQSFALICSVVLGAGLLVGVLCFILSWIPPVERLLVRVLRRRFFIVACLVTLIALFYAEENFRGKWRWDHYRREWEAKGEKFDLASFVPPPVPDDQNFALTPLLRPLFDFVHGTNGIQWQDTNGLARLEGIRVDQTPRANMNNVPAFGNMERGRFIDLAAWNDFYRGNTNYPQPAVPGTAAANILTALGKFDAEMAELQKAAVTRPRSRFPIHYEDEPPFAILLPHLAHVKGLCQPFVLRAIARLELHQSDEALADLQTAFRLSDSIRDEPFLIDHLVRIATLAIGLEGVRGGLVRHAWNDAQLAAIEKYLASLDILAEYEKNMRGERSLNLAGTEYYRKLGFNARPTEFFSMTDDGGAVRQVPGFMESLNFMPGGWYYQNMVAISRVHQDSTLAAVDEEKHRVFPDIADNRSGISATDGWAPYNIFARLLSGGLSRSSMRSARIQTFVDAARIGVALERYRLANGKLPDTLDALAPRLIGKIPNDVIDGKPLRYRLNADGSYVIYSIGWNQTDDGGIIPAPDQNRGTDKSKDDWVWQMPGR